ncbi:hypothetical protein CHS0354_033348 [Potamilus streckersoni]|uniref:EGF-like calcium-binding domain-containing protein n=1 Tax=Potamilus streckersoni TaxID=2493646 RepID=A0AAE0VJQ7_9BIVA|nr:hypothetical protein CHS0354_033348 [Potamilus streckersoni]
MCSCNISNSLTVNQTCDRINGTCFCKEGWMGADCNQDINECESEPAVCQKIKNSGCYNIEGSFKCLCHMGYKPDGNGGCVEDVQQNTTPIPVELYAGYTSITISITLNFKLPTSMDIKVPENYAKMEREAKISLSEFYISTMGQMFQQIIIQSIRQGSLIVNYRIICKKSDETILKLAEANADLATGNITLASQECTALGLTVGEKQLLVGGSSSDKLCNSYLSVAGECASGYECVISNSRPRCSPVKKQDDFDLYVPIGIGAAFFVLLCLVIAVVIIRSKRPEVKRLPEEVRRKSGPDFNQTWNLKHSKTAEDAPKWISVQTNDIYRSTHLDDASNRYVDFNLLGHRNFNERDAIGMNHYDMPGPSHEYETIPPTKAYRIKRPKVYGLVNRSYDNQM